MQLDFNRPFGPKLPIDKLTTQQQIALLCRILVKRGYSDDIAGHITATAGDGNLYVNPYGLPWDEVKASDIIKIDLDGNVVEGEYGVNPGVELHLAMQRLSDEIAWVLHNHPEYGTVWADAARIPPCYDQSSMYCGKVALVNEYGGSVDDITEAGDVAKELGADAEVAILAHHGVVVMGRSVEVITTRALSLELRCRNAWRAESIGAKTEIKTEIQERFGMAMGYMGLPGQFEALVRRELRADSKVLE